MEEKGANPNKLQISEEKTPKKATFSVPPLKRMRAYRDIFESIRDSKEQSTIIVKMKKSERLKVFKSSIMVFEGSHHRICLLFYYSTSEMSSLVGIFREIDPEVIQKQESNKKHFLRKKLIVKYLIHSYYTGFKEIEDKKQQIMVKNTYSMLKFNLFISLIFNYVLYKLLFSFTFDYRGFTLNPNKLSRLIKVPISTVISLGIAGKVWTDYCYNVDIYEPAVQYNAKFDKNL